MCDEMLALIKDGLDQPDGINIDQKELGGAQEQNISDNEGFNDERDNEWEEAKQAEDDKNKFKREARKKRFDETLSTVQEESEMENTFKDSHYHANANSLIANGQKL